MVWKESARELARKALHVPFDSGAPAVTAAIAQGSSRS
jgi:hypothetical protein